MPLSCSCDLDGDWDWTYYAPRDYSTLDTKRSRRCSSCQSLIGVGAICAEFTRTRSVNSDIEERIYGEDGKVYLASMYLCEECADLWFSLNELGFECVGPDEPMRDLVREYAATFGPGA